VGLLCILPSVMNRHSQNRARCNTARSTPPPSEAEGGPRRRREVYWFTRRRPDGVELTVTVNALDDSVGVIVRWPGAADAVASASMEYVRSLRFLDWGDVIEIISGATQHPTRCILLLAAGTPLDIVLTRSGWTTYPAGDLGGAPDPGVRAVCSPLGPRASESRPDPGSRHGRRCPSVR
jgi:hypothetical protein